MIVLDNCEHVIGACAEHVGAILTTCAQVRVLATSREPLGVDGETIWRLEPLAADDARRLSSSGHASVSRSSSRTWGSRGAPTAFESTAAPGDGPPLHSHANEDEVIHVLEGRLRVRLEDAIHTAPAGSFVFFPRGVPHTWQNAGDEPARLLVRFTPASPGMERSFDRAAEALEGTPADDAFNCFVPGTGMEVLGPPLAITHSAALDQ